MPRGKRNPMNTPASTNTQDAGRPADIEKIDQTVSTLATRFGMQAELVATTPVEDKLAFVASAVDNTLTKLSQLVTATAAKSGLTLERGQSMLGTMQSLFDQLLTKVTALDPKALRKVANMVNEQLPFPYSKLPEDGTTALSMVMAAAEHQRQATVAAR